MSKHILVTIVVAVVVAAAGFFGGYKYGLSKAPKASTARSGAFAGGAGTAGTRRFGTGNDFVNGTILSSDNGQLTVQLRAAPGAATSTATGSKIVILSANTQIFKSVQGTPADLSVGQNVTATGVDNSSGAMTAQTIQIRQAPAAGQGGPGGQTGANPPPPGQ